MRIPQVFQGPTGSGQGGWTTARFLDIVGQPATVGIRAPIPLDTDLVVVEATDGSDGDDVWHLVDPTSETPTIIMEARRWDPEFASTEPITLDQAREAGNRFPLNADDHPVPNCFSCGLQPESMNVRAGPLGDGRFAAIWSAPEWAIGADGSVDGAVLWAALDCTAGWYTGIEGGIRSSFTVQYAVEVSKAVEPGESYALVGWNGDGPPYWDGRKRTGASAAFDKSGICIARSRSFWVAAE